MWVPISTNDLCMKAKDLESAIKASGRPVAFILVAHLWGRLADLDPVFQVAKKYNIVRREDVDIKDVAAFGPPDILINLLDDYIKAGATKFTLRSACPPEMTFEQMSLLGKHIVPRYHSGWDFLSINSHPVWLVPTNYLSMVTFGMFNEL